MKLSLNWLKDYIDIDMPPEELGHLLTMAGLEVEGIEWYGNNLGGIIAARIVEISPHPDADHLKVCRVHTGKEQVQVVCGAPNVALNSITPFAGHGVSLPDGTEIKKVKLRGVISNGMLLSEDEMGLTNDHTGLFILPSHIVPGTDLSSLEGGPDSFSDCVLDLSVTPNRPDWASVLGVAREISAIIGRPVKNPDIVLKTGDSAIESLTSVTVHDIKGCPRYTAGMIQGVQLKRSPFWMRYRLYLSGIRSINNVVDVTNYVLLEMGQPLHSFDYNRLKENRIEVRRAKQGEVFVTLDEESRTLSDETLLICDGERPVALAGIMGGLNSEIYDQTKDVLLESAFFDPVTIRRASKKLGLSTEASYRFERGADIEGTPVALKRALSLIHSLAGGTIAAGMIDQYPEPYRAFEINLNVDKTNRALGTAISKDVLAGYMTALGMDVQTIDEKNLIVKPPSFRVDISREIDLVEEAARLFGYDNIPVTNPSVQPDETVASETLVLRDRIRSLLAGVGFSEIINYSFTTPESADRLEAEKASDLRSFVSLLNPLSVDQSVMRTSLVHGILNTVKYNLSHDEKDMSLFEWGKVFFHRENNPQPLEKVFLSGVMTGIYNEKTWYGQERAVDFFDVKGAMEVLLEDLCVRAVSFQKHNLSPVYDPELSAGIFSNDFLIGSLGRLSGPVMEAYDFKEDAVYIFEIDIQALVDSGLSTKSFVSFAKFPAVYRDISLLVKREINSAHIMKIARQQGGNLLESIHIFDLYEGKNLDPTEKALTFRLCYRSTKETLDGEKINRLHASVIDKVRQETGGRLREG